MSSSVRLYMLSLESRTRRYLS